MILKPTIIAITAVGDQLIGHYFETETEALKKLPFIKHWDRTTWDSRYVARYHSKAAEQYWASRGLSDRIYSTAIYYYQGKEVKRIYS